MSSTLVRTLIAAGAWAAAATCGLGQRRESTTPPPRTEPGLEQAVKWKWNVAPSNSTWGIPIPDPTPPPAAAVPIPQPVEAVTYEVKKGDALAIIARRFELTVQHLKVYNDLTSDLIHIGQIIRIPSLAEAQAIAPLPEKRVARGKDGKPARVLGPSKAQLDVAAMQAFLDREQFSTGPITGEKSLIFDKIVHLYMTAHPEAMDPAVLNAKIQETVGDGFTRYTLRERDFRYIAPPRAQPLTKEGEEPVEPKLLPPTYEDLTSAKMLTYRTPWEFVAERFHCSEAFLRLLNSHIKTAPVAGTELRVPNVDPFAVESVFGQPLQPPANPALKVRAAVLDLSILQIFENDKLVAAMPLSMARPGLRGRDEWVILNAMPRPRLATRQELRDPPQRTQPLFGSSRSDPAPPPPPTLTADQFLADGPRNPVGIIWINLAKANDSEVLSYGLHGTSTPDRMLNSYSLGGLQVANWDIARASRMLPNGTVLEWRQGMAASAAPVAQPAQ